MAEYPEHEKLTEIKDQSQAIGEFLDYSDYTLCEYKHEAGVPRWVDARTGKPSEPPPWGGSNAIENPDWYPEGYYAVQKPITKILADWFKIDEDKLETEKREMLARLRGESA